MQTAADMVQGRRRRNLVRLVEELTELRASFFHTLQETESTPERRDLREFTEKLEDWWRIAGELAQAIKAATDLEDNLRASDQARMNLFATSIATLGFPLLELHCDGDRERAAAAVREQLELEPLYLGRNFVCRNSRTGLCGHYIPAQSAGSRPNSIGQDAATSSTWAGQ